MTVAFWGFDIAGDSRTVIAAVQAFAGAYPSWIGRYIGSPFEISSAEAAWIHANGARILPIYDGAEPGDVASVYTHGQEHGQLAVAAAKRVGVAAGVALPVDVEASWLPTADFLAGYADAVHAGGYTGAVYLNVLEATHIGAWRAARKWTGNPLWIYSSEPELTAWTDLLRNDWYPFTELGADAASVLWHQYNEADLSGSVDFDNATQQGYDLLWAPATPPPTATITQDCALKVAPSHTSRVAIDPAHHPVQLIVGQVVTPTGQKQETHGESWARITLPGGPVWGWVPSVNLRTA